MNRDRLQPRPLLTPAEALGEANRCQGCVDAACQKGCPLQVDVGAFIRRIQTGHWAGALRVMYERNPLPETCALICPVETLCEGKCNSGELSYPVRISELQQAAAHYGAEAFRRQPPTTTQPAGTVAIVGAGPAGLACAARLRLDGFEVHLFEKTNTLGGALAWWIPSYRLPPNTLQKEIQRIIALGVTVHTNQALGRDLSLDTLRQRFDAIFLGMGLGDDRRMQVPGRSGPNVFDALKMLEMANAGQFADLPEPVVVIGGGNTAVDAAVTARYLGAREVYLVYRRSFIQMPAWPAERHRAVDLGIHVLVLLRPIGYLRDPAGNLAGVRCLRTRMHPAEQGGRDVPVDVPGSEFVLPAGCVIEAVGQQPDTMTRSALSCLAWTRESTLAVHPATQETSLPGVFAGGDIVNGGRTAVEAIAEALRAAEAIKQYVYRRKGR